MFIEDTLWFGKPTVHLTAYIRISEILHVTPKVRSMNISEGSQLMIAFPIPEYRMGTYYVLIYWYDNNHVYRKESMAISLFIKFLNKNFSYYQEKPTKLIEPDHEY